MRKLRMEIVKGSTGTLDPLHHVLTQASTFRNQAFMWRTAALDARADGRTGLARARAAHARSFFAKYRRARRAAGMGV